MFPQKKAEDEELKNLKETQGDMLKGIYCSVGEKTSMSHQEKSWFLQR